MFNINESARANFDAKANKLLEALTVEEDDKPSKGKFDFEFNPTFTLNEEDITGLRKLNRNPEGINIGFSFRYNDLWVGLKTEDQVVAKKLCLAIVKCPCYEPFLSYEYVVNHLFEWLEKQYISPNSNQNFVMVLNQNATKDVKVRHLLIPVSGLKIEKEFSFGNLVFQPLISEFFDRLEKAQIALAPDKDSVTSTKSAISNFRESYLGFAAVKLELNCEPNLALEVALKEGERAINLLGIYSAFCLDIDKKNNCRLVGDEHIPSYTVFQQIKSYGFIKASGFRNANEETFWFVSEKKLRDFNSIGLEVVSRLLKEENLNVYESKVLTSLFLYSKASFTADPMEKLVFTLSALESFLLKDKGENIQQNLAERLSFLTKRAPEDRISLVKDLKAVYGIRSDYLHHGFTTKDREKLSSFFSTVFNFFVLILDNIDKFKSPDALFQYIETLKYN